MDNESLYPLEPSAMDVLFEEANSPPSSACKPRLIALKPLQSLDAYHVNRAEKHGWLYRVTRVGGFYKDMYEATSLADGFQATLLKRYTTPFPPEDSDAVQEPS